MSQRQALLKLIGSFDQENLVNFFRKAHEDFKPAGETFPEYVAEEPDFLEVVQQVGKIEFGLDERLLVFRAKTTGDITKRTSKRRQYDLAKKMLKSKFSDAGIFVFHDDRGHFRFSLVVTHFEGTRRTFTPFRRYTYYVNPEKPNKTFINQVGKADFSDLDSILKAFSIDAVSDDFYDEFKPKFQAIADATKGADVDQELKEDFALLFAIRVIFLGFVQKKKTKEDEKGWLGNDEEFLQHYWEEYNEGDFEEDTFYNKWLKPLFFKALNSQPGTHVSRQTNFSDETREALQMAPYLNGNLFKEKSGYDDIGLWIPDEEIEAFFEFLFRHNFTVEENTYYDQELELNPEFLGIIFEKLVNKEDGAVYTPRTEVDFMCRMGLVKWLQKNTAVNTRDLYRLFFQERGKEKDQKQGDFSPNEISELVEKLENVTVCDPAAGSGAFEVGMLHVLKEILENLYDRSNAPSDITPKSGYDLKKSIIARSLYGVEIKQWAVWINHLRLWLTLFIDMPDDEKRSMKPLLPSLNFKVRCGDSLVQRIGSKLFPVQGHADLPAKIKRKVTELKKTKTNFFNNKGVSEDEVTHQEFTLFQEIIREELDEKRQTLNLLEQQEKRAAQTQQGSLGTEFREPENDQGNLEFDEADKDKLKEEIAELEEQEKKLAEDHPLIWNIEFAEIFVEKGGFDVIIGNPPYLKQGEIRDPQKNISSTDYYNYLKQLVHLDFPDHFKGDLEVNGRSNLLIFFYLHTLMLINKSGQHVFITSNSWLDSGYGNWFKYLLLKKVPIENIIDNHAKRSFSNAQINTVITLLESPEIKDSSVDDKIKFIAFKKPFEDVVITENLLEIESANESLANSNYRLFITNNTELIKEGSEFANEEDRIMGQGVYKRDKWGSKYLRAPDVFIELLENAEDNIIELGQRAEVITVSWSRKGFNSEVIVPNGEEVKTEFELVKLFKSPKDVKKIEVTPSETKYRLKVIPEIENGIKYAPLLWGDLKDKRFVCHYCGTNVAFSHGFHGIRPMNNVNLSSLALVLNSTLTWLMIEVFGRKGLGGGATRVLVKEMRKIFSIPDPNLISSQEAEELFNKIRDVEVKSVFEELGLNPSSEVAINNQDPSPRDYRYEIDKLVCQSIGVDLSILQDLYKTVCRLVKERKDKAGSL